MASIERTAYPRFKLTLTSQELVDLYTPTPAELAFAQRQTSSPTRQFSVLVLLKAFQRLGYFPKLAEAMPGMTKMFSSSEQELIRFLFRFA